MHWCVVRCNIHLTRLTMNCILMNSWHYNKNDKNVVIKRVACVWPICTHTLTKLHQHQYGHWICDKTAGLYLRSTLTRGQSLEISTTLTALTHLLAAMDGTRGHDPSLLPWLRTGLLTRTAVTNNSAIQHQCRSRAATITSMQRRQLLAVTPGDGKSSQQSFRATLRKHERKIKTNDWTSGLRNNQQLHVRTLASCYNCCAHSRRPTTALVRCWWLLARCVLLAADCRAPNVLARGAISRVP